MTGQKDTIHNNILCHITQWKLCQPFELPLLSGVFNNNKRLIKYALFVPLVNSNVLAKRIFSLEKETEMEQFG